MTKIVCEIQIGAPKDTVWEIISNLEAVQYYDAGVVQAYYISERNLGVGAARHCDLIDGGYVRERVTEWKPGEGYAITVYEGSEVIVPFESQNAIFTLRDAEEGTSVSMELGYELKSDVPMDPNEMESQSRELVEGVLSGLKHYVETGEPVSMTIPDAA